MGILIRQQQKQLARNVGKKRVWVSILRRVSADRNVLFVVNISLITAKTVCEITHKRLWAHAELLNDTIWATSFEHVRGMMSRVYSVMLLVLCGTKKNVSLMLWLHEFGEKGNSVIGKLLCLLSKLVQLFVNLFIWRDRKLLHLSLEWFNHSFLLLTIDLFASQSLFRETRRTVNSSTLRVNSVELKCYDDQL